MKHSLKILMASTSYPENERDWRGRFIANLAAGLGKRPDVRLSLWAPPGDLPAGVANAAIPTEHRWLHRLSHRGGIAHILKNDKMRAPAAIGGLLLRLRRVYRRSGVDVVHVNWLQNALPLWGTRTPAVVSVLGSDFGLLRLPGMKALLRGVFRQRRVILAPNAEWMARELEQAFGDIAEIRPVPFGVDASWFELPRRPGAHGVHHWIAVTRLTREKLGDLLQWGNGCFGEKRILHLFGPMQENIALPAWIRYHGPTHPQALRSEWFPAATGLITLSRHDEGRPQVMLEAMAAGLPVLASDIAAHRDFLEHGRTGWLVDSPSAFAAALNDLEQGERAAAIGVAARDWVRQQVGTWDDCAARYAALYSRLAEPAS